MKAAPWLSLCKQPSRKIFVSPSFNFSILDQQISLLRRPVPTLREHKRTVWPAKMTPKVKLQRSDILHPPYAETGHVTGEKHSEIEIKTPVQIDKMKKAGEFAGRVLAFAGRCVQPGKKTDTINEEVHNFIVSQGIYPSPLNYQGFPKSICSSVNEVLCHGIPDQRELKRGEIVKIDVSTYVDSVHGDCCGTFFVGDEKEAGERVTNLVKVAKFCRDEAIKLCGPGVPFSAIGHLISYVTEKTGYYSVEELCGHGIGSIFHMNPSVFHYRNQEPYIMKPGMTFTIEPIIVDHDKYVPMTKWEDNWTLVSANYAWAAQWEHTILITQNGAEILTLSDF